MQLAAVSRACYFWKMLLDHLLRALVLSIAPVFNWKLSCFF